MQTVSVSHQSKRAHLGGRKGVDDIRFIPHVGVHRDTVVEFFYNTMSSLVLITFYPIPTLLSSYYFHTNRQVKCLIGKVQSAGKSAPVMLKELYFNVALIDIGPVLQHYKYIIDIGKGWMRQG